MGALSLLNSDNGDYDLTSLVTVFTDTPSASAAIRCQGYIAFGDGVKDLDGTGGDFQLVITIGGQTIEPSPQVITFSTAVRCAIWTSPFVVPPNSQVLFRVLSPNSGDSDVDVTAYLYDISDVNVTAISGDTIAADNLELQYDGTGLSGETFPATQLQGTTIDTTTSAIKTVTDNIPDSGNLYVLESIDAAIGNLPDAAAIADQVWDEEILAHNVESSFARELLGKLALPGCPVAVATGATVTTGTPTNTYTATHAADATFHAIAHSGFEYDVTYTFAIQAGAQPVGLIWKGYDASNSMTIQVYDYDADAFVSVDTEIAASSIVAPVTRHIPLTEDMVDTVTNPGEVQVRFFSTSTLGMGTDFIGIAFQPTGITSSDISAALATYDAPTKAELDAGFAALNDLSAAQVNAEVDTALADYDPPTKAEMDTAFSGLNDLSAAAVNAEVDTALADYDGPTRAEATADKVEILTVLGTPVAASIAADIAAIPTASENATELLSTTVDGKAVSLIFQRINARARGKFELDGSNVLTYYAEDGVTALFSLTLTSSGGTPV